MFMFLFSCAMPWLSFVGLMILVSGEIMRSTLQGKILLAP